MTKKTYCFLVKTAYHLCTLHLPLSNIKQNKETKGKGLPMDNTCQSETVISGKKTHMPASLLHLENGKERWEALCEMNSFDSEKVVWPHGYIQVCKWPDLTGYVQVKFKTFDLEGKITLSLRQVSIHTKMQICIHIHADIHAYHLINDMKIEVWQTFFISPKKGVYCIFFII